MRRRGVAFKTERAGAPRCLHAPVERAIGRWCRRPSEDRRRRKRWGERHSEDNGMNVAVSEAATMLWCYHVMGRYGDSAVCHLWNAQWQKGVVFIEEKKRAWLQREGPYGYVSRHEPQRGVRGSSWQRAGREGECQSVVAASRVHNHAMSAVKFSCLCSTAYRQAERATQEQCHRKEGEVPKRGAQRQVMRYIWRECTGRRCRRASEPREVKWLCYMEKA